MCIIMLVDCVLLGRMAKSFSEFCNVSMGNQREGLEGCTFC